MNDMGHDMSIVGLRKWNGMHWHDMIDEWGLDDWTGFDRIVTPARNCNCHNMVKG